MSDTGRLDGLTITPIVRDDGSLAFARVALIPSLPGFDEPTESQRADIQAQHDLDHATRSMP